MTDFGHIAKQEVNKEATRELPLNTIEGGIILIVRPGTQQNKAYTDAKLKRLPTVDRGTQTGLTVKVLESLQTTDRKLLALHIIEDWRNVTDAKGKSVPFSPEAAVDFCNALPTRTLTEIAKFVENADNFVDEAADPRVTSGEVQAQAKN